MTDKNPLLHLEIPLPFDRIRPEQVAPALEELIASAQRKVDEIASLDGARGFENTMIALDLASEPLDRATGIVRHLESVITTPELRQAWNEAQPKVTSFYSSVPMHAGLWRALQDYSSTEEAAQLEGVRRRFLTKTIDNFKRHGAALAPAEKKTLEALDVELAQAATKFAQNVLDATAKWEYVVTDERELAGLPESAIEAARASAVQKGQEGWRFTLQQPSYLAVMTYLDDASVREKLWRAYNTRAAEQNAGLILRILDLRRKRAELLGYSSFADLVLADRMAKTGSSARAFVDDLTAKTEAAFLRENESLARFRRSCGDGGSMHPWDVAYWAEKHRQAEFEFNEEDLRPYFPMERVIAGLFDLVHRLYGIRVEETDGVPVWHDEVKHFDLLDSDGTRLGSFYADWYPRESKRGGAWMDSFITGPPHVGLMCGNMTPPVGEKPSLLTHREVETVFHEFGHLLHHLLSRVEIKSLSGTSVAWDFVELPSQIMENWCWERESLDLFARHWKTHEVLPEELFAKLKAARTFRGANAQMRQLGFGTLDLCLHTEFDPSAATDVVAYANSLLARFSPAPLTEDYAMICAFTHLFADAVGYGAGYYSYKWAEVLDADAFTRFKREGVFSREAGRAFRAHILERGNSEEPSELFRRFMGRDPDPSALLDRLGLLAQAQ